MSDLKLCPFCGPKGKAQADSFGWKKGAVGCMTCGCWQESVEAWNTRAHPPGSPQNPHMPGTVDKPTDVYVGEWLVTPYRTGMFIRQDHEDADCIMIAETDGSTKWQDAPEGFTFHNRMRD